MSFAILYKGSEHREASFVQQRSLDIAHMILKYLRQNVIIEKDLKEYLELMGFSIVQDKMSILEDKNKQYIWEKKRRRMDIQGFKLEEKNYLHLKNNRLNILLLHTNKFDNFRTFLFLYFYLF